MRTATHVLATNESGVRIRTSQVAAAAEAALDAHHAAGQAVILLTGDERMRELNRLFRGIDSPTDVLTFPAGSIEQGLGIPGHIGDIAISVETARRQAAQRMVSLNEELCWLAIHGALHLLGFEDESDIQREEMQREMNRIAMREGLTPDHGWVSAPEAESSP